MGLYARVLGEPVSDDLAKYLRPALNKRPVMPFLEAVSYAVQDGHTTITPLFNQRPSEQLQ